jgi:4-hydroxy-tetrahydrodipicolinate reductase
MDLPIKLIINGFGKVGQEVKHKTQEDGSWIITAVVDPWMLGVSHQEITGDLLSQTDVIIDFSHGDALLPLMQKITAYAPRVRLVIGTSAWGKDAEAIKKLVAQHGLFCLYGANFSIATALFMHLVRYATDLFNTFPEFDPSLLEIHHRHKKDMPSGTAKAIAQDIVDRSDAKTSMLYGMEDRAIRPEELHVSCLRTGENKGFHQVSFDAMDEVVTISQQNRDRGAYAAGALQAAKWLMEQTTPGFYSFDDCIKGLLPK